MLGSQNGPAASASSVVSVLPQPAGLLTLGSAETLQQYENPPNVKNPTVVKANAKVQQAQGKLDEIEELQEKIKAIPDKDLFLGTCLVRTCAGTVGLIGFRGLGFTIVGGSQELRTN